jgi:hypothetical protein
LGILTTKGEKKKKSIQTRSLVFTYAKHLKGESMRVIFFGGNNKKYECAFAREGEEMRD